MNKASGNMETVYQTEAQWTADERVFTADVVAVTTDGANAGKHKLFRGTGRWTTLTYVEDGGSGSTTVMSVDGVKYDELITLTGTTDAIGDFTINFTTLVNYPGIASASFVAAAQAETNTAVGIPYGFDLNDFKVGFVDIDGAALGAGVAVQATFMIKYA